MKRHMSTNFDGLLAMSDYKLRKIAKDCMIDGKPLRTAKQVREMLLMAKKEGMMVIPCPECDNYDERGYCKGHE